MVRKCQYNQSLRAAAIGRTKVQPQRNEKYARVTIDDSENGSVLVYMWSRFLEVEFGSVTQSF